jgi:hypothetical protein
MIRDIFKKIFYNLLAKFYNWIGTLINTSQNLIKCHFKHRNFDIKLDIYYLKKCFLKKGHLRH